MGECIELVVILPFYSFYILIYLSIKEILKIIILSYPNTIDFILTSFFCTLKLKEYFIIRFINQLLIFFYFIGAYDQFRVGNRDGMGNIIPAISFSFILFCFIICEIKSLTVFVEVYNNENLTIFIKINYYFHFIIVPYCIFVFRYLKKYM